MEANEVRRRAVLVEQNAFNACSACAGAVGHDPAVGIVCARNPQLDDCGLLEVNKLRTAVALDGIVAEDAEEMLARMTPEWAMGFVRGEDDVVPVPAPKPSLSSVPSPSTPGAVTPAAAAAASANVAPPPGSVTPSPASPTVSTQATSNSTATPSDAEKSES